MSTHKIVQIWVTVAIFHPRDITGTVRIRDGSRVRAARVRVHTQEDVRGVVAVAIRSVDTSALATIT